MGTIEHFDETERAVHEMARVLKPGGRAIVGVPNRHDPFLRPLLATVLQAIGLYGYGYEKSYSRRALRQMLEKAGLTVVEETAILFIPGWLRMLDLACHSWFRPLAAVTGILVRPFVFLDRPSRPRRHGTARPSSQSGRPFRRVARPEIRARMLRPTRPGSDQLAISQRFHLPSWSLSFSLSLSLSWWSPSLSWSSSSLSWWCPCLW